MPKDFLSAQCHTLLSKGKDPFNYTKWHNTLYDGMSIEELSKKAMDNLKDDS